MKYIVRALSFFGVLIFLLPVGGCKQQETEPVNPESVAAVLSPSETERASDEIVAETKSEEESVPAAVAPVAGTAANHDAGSETARSAASAGEAALLQKVKAALAKEKSTLKEGEAVLTFAGDCTIGSYPECGPQKRFETYLDAAGSPTYPFDLVKDWFQADDQTIINFEGTLTTATKMANKSWRFKGRPAFAGILTKSGVEIATLANNHSRDYLETGYQDTIQHLTSENILVGDRGRPVRFSARGMNFVILSYNLWPVVDIAKTNADVTKICEEISQSAKGEAAVIVCLHWGKEYEPVTASQKRYARQMIDAGAELIIGHHPHILQGVERYKGKYICYSLGNFAFGGNATVRAESLDTVLVRPRFLPEGDHAICTGLTVVPCHMTSHSNLKINNYRPRPLFGKDARRVVDRLLRLSSALPDGISQLDSYSIG